MNPYLALMVFTVTLAVGQLLFKLVAVRADWARPGETLLLQPALWVALAFYGGATLLWVWILKQVPLTLAYPFVAAGFILVPLGAWAFFGEPVTWRYSAGVALIVAGVVLTAT
jgi:undecaprenyl phosphate-alpha-L-ara4N flippase subunit ArnE